MDLIDNRPSVYSIIVVILIFTSMWVGMIVTLPKEVSGEDHNGVTITSLVTWYSEDNPHNITGTVIVTGSGKLTIKEEAVIRLNPDSNVYVDNEGRLYAKGKSTQQIIFTSNESSPSSGDWDGILFGTNNKKGLIQHCNLNYPAIGIEVKGGPVNIENSVINDSTKGISVKGGSVNIYNNTINNADGEGIYIQGSNSKAEIINNTIINSETGIKIKDGSSVIKNNIIKNCNHGIWIEKSITLENCTIINSTSDNIYIVKSADVKTINCTYDSRNNISSGSLLIKQWHLNFYVNDTFGNPLNDVNITLIPKVQSPIEYRTNTMGWRRKIACTESENSSTGITHMNPYTIMVNKNGYNTTTIQKNITRTDTLYFTLQDIDKPESALNEVLQYWFNSSEIELNYSVNDNSQLNKISLNFNHSMDNLLFSDTIESESIDIIGDQTSANGSFIFNFDAGEGHYNLFTLATDKIGNSEIAEFALVRKIGKDISKPEFVNVEVTDITEDSLSVCRVYVTIKDTLSGLMGPPMISYKYDSAVTSWFKYEMQMKKSSRTESVPQSPRTGESVYYYDIPIPVGGWEYYQNKSLVWEITCSDLVGNANITSGMERVNYINHAPEMRITEPMFDSWNNGIITIHTTPTDDLDFNDTLSEWGIAFVYVQYSIDSTEDGKNGTWRNCTEAPITAEPFDIYWNSTGILTNGNVWLRAQCIDTGGLASEWNLVQIQIDNEPGSSTIIDYTDTWHNSDFQIKLTAVDGVGSGIERSYYNLNNKIIQNTAMDGMPIITDESANNKLEYWSVDLLKNEEEHNFVYDIKLDKTKPILTDISCTNITSTTATDDEVTLMVTATDALSGLRYAPQYRFQCPGENYSIWYPMDLESGERYKAIINMSEFNRRALGGEMLLFEIECTDNALNTRSTTLSEFIDNSSYEPLVITHTPVSKWYVNKTIVINATVTAGEGVDDVRVYYKPVGEESFTSIPMARSGTSGSNRYSCELPAQVSFGVVYYYISAHDNLYIVTLPEFEPEENAFAINIVQEDIDVIDNELPEWWLEQYFGDLIDYIAVDDPDGDGLSNLEEYQNGTDPTKNDTDGDDLPDKWEIDNELDPGDPTGDNGAFGDPDGDGYLNREKFEAEQDTEPTVDDQTPKPKAGSKSDDTENRYYLVIIFIMIVIIIFLSFSTFRRRKNEGRITEEPEEFLIEEPPDELAPEVEIEDVVEAEADYEIESDVDLEIESEDEYGSEPVVEDVQEPGFELKDLPGEEPETREELEDDPEYDEVDEELKNQEQTLENLVDSIFSEDANEELEEEVEEELEEELDKEILEYMNIKAPARKTVIPGKKFVKKIIVKKEPIKKDEEDLDDIDDIEIPEEYSD